MLQEDQLLRSGAEAMLGSKYGNLAAQTTYSRQTIVDGFKQARATKPKFRFHKNLNSSRYNEFLADSDDEEFFNSKPVTKDGKEFDFDFKIDTYRDQIRFNKHKGDKTSK